jgi:hypothetical protein
MHVQKTALVAGILVMFSLESCNNPSSSAAAASCQAAGAADLMHTLGAANVLLWKSPNDAVNHLYLNESRQLLASAPGKVTAARLPRTGHERMSRIVREMTVVLDQFAATIGNGQITPANVVPPGNRLISLNNDAMAVVREGCR